MRAEADIHTVAYLHRGPAVLLGYVTLVSSLSRCEHGSTRPFLLALARISAIVAISYLAGWGLARHRPWARWLMIAFQLALAAQIGNAFIVNVGFAAPLVRLAMAGFFVVALLGWAGAVIWLLARPSIDPLFSPEQQKRVAASLPRKKDFGNDSFFLAYAAVVIVVAIVIGLVSRFLR